MDSYRKSGLIGVFLLLFLCLSTGAAGDGLRVVQYPAGISG
jgi:hypothetical protein